MLTAYGVAVLTFMMLMYALERRGPAFVAAFACGCALSSSYGFLAGTWPFGVVEAIWAVIALQRYRVLRRERHDLRSEESARRLGEERQISVKTDTLDASHPQPQ